VEIPRLYYGHILTPREVLRLGHRPLQGSTIRACMEWLRVFRIFEAIIHREQVMARPQQVKMLLSTGPLNISLEASAWPSLFWISVLGRFPTSRRRKQKWWRISICESWLYKELQREAQYQFTRSLISPSSWHPQRRHLVSKENALGAMWML
jgi:hypothetical protein